MKTEWVWGKCPGCETRLKLRGTGADRMMDHFRVCERLQARVAKRMKNVEVGK